jgi:hypothetical protein
LAAVDQKIKDIELKMSLWPAVLERIESAVAVIVDDNHLAINKRIQRQLFAGPSDL